MKTKKVLFTLFVLVFLLLSINFVLAEDVCCEITKDRDWCQYVDRSECAPDSKDPVPTACSELTYCKKGTCIDENRGTCMPSPEGACTSGGGTWDARTQDEIPMCQDGCCLYGGKSAYVSHPECQQLASDWNVNVQFRTDIISEDACLTYYDSREIGACIIEQEFVTNCSMATGTECSNKGGNFHEEMLCTAPGLSDCAKSEKTTCHNNNQVYFLDTCGNLANVYDEDMYTLSQNAWTQEMENYWTYVKEPECNVNGADESCGTCNYNSGTVCRKYKSGDEGMPSSAPKYGDYVCREVNCYYDTNRDGTKKEYKHGESWCANSEGVYYKDMQPGEGQGIRVNLTTGKLLTLKSYLENETKYNLPGSRYYKLECWDGEVIPYPCKDYRNEICKEGFLTEDYMYAQCRVNNWRLCSSINNSEECEDLSGDCKWIPGYKLNFNIVKKLNEDTEDNDEQGSCVALYAPGLEFWGSDGKAQSICAAGFVMDTALFETHWIKNRDKFRDQSTKTAANRCFGNCYVLPDYGKDLSLETIKKVYRGKDELGESKIEGNYYLSDRAGQYCCDKNIWGTIDCDKRETGEIVGEVVDCATKKRRILPLFYTHEQWLESIRERARSIGDCGVKESFIGEPGKQDTEIITAIFQQLKQDGSLKKNGTIETIYVGNERIFDEDEYSRN